MPSWWILIPVLISDIFPNKNSLFKGLDLSILKILLQIGFARGFFFRL